VSISSEIKKSRTKKKKREGRLKEGPKAPGERGAPRGLKPKILRFTRKKSNHSMKKGERWGTSRRGNFRNGVESKKGSGARESSGLVPWWPPSP